MHHNFSKLLAAAGVVAALAAVPGTAFARGGGGTGGGGGGGGGGVVTPTDPASDPSCATIEATNSGILDQIASRKPIALDFNVANCSQHTETLDTSLQGTGYSLLSLDPLTEATCETPVTAAPTLTLKPREKRSISVTPAACNVQYGINGRQWTYTATTSDAATGTALAATQSTVLQRTGF